MIKEVAEYAFKSLLLTPQGGNLPESFSEHAAQKVLQCGQRLTTAANQQTIKALRGDLHLVDVVNL